MSTIQTQGTEEIHPDVLLVNRAREGDVEAFEKLVRQYDRQVFRIAQHITQNREDAEDVVQDAFLKAYEKLDQFQGNSKFYTWLVRIAVNESLMRLRKRRTGRMVSIDEDVETPRSCGLGSEPRADVRAIGDGGDSPQDNPGFASGIPGGLRPAGRGRTFDRGNGGNSGFKYSGSKVAPAAGAAAVAGAAQPLLPQ